MQALVLLDLVFVQMTGSAGMHWLVPLYVFALAAPLLERFRNRLAYRMAWNAGLICFSGVLLRHALRADLAYVLEDGLVMAVFCQVHLLNNLRSSQRPDLLFFNAFLIAIITGFMTEGLGFPIAFLFFAPCFVVGLELLNASRSGALSTGATRRLAMDGGKRAALVLGLSLLVFLFWPRDFQRKAFFHGRLQLMASRPERMEVGFNEKLELDRRGPVGASDREALRVTLLEGQTSDVSPLWRGATLGATNDGAWSPIGPIVSRTAGPSDEPWERQPGRLLRPGSQGSEISRVAVLRFEQETERLFAPLPARGLVLGAESAGALLRPRLDGTVDTDETGDVHYELVLARASTVELGGQRVDELPAGLVPYVALPATGRLDRARDLAAGLVAPLPPDSEQHALVSRLSDHLSESYAYLAPGSEESARSLDEFLAGDGGGHCEFFASAMATMLRTLGIPCRVVTGYRSTRWEDGGRVLSFAMRDAHAWVEVHDPNAGWYAVDPSPPLALQSASTSLWARLSSGAQAAWASVTGFDSERRAAFVSWMKSAPARIAAAFRERPLEAALATLLVIAAVVLVVRRRLSRTPSPVRAYRRAVRRAGLGCLPGETPRELLARAKAAVPSRERLIALAAATRRHESERYAA